MVQSVQNNGTLWADVFLVRDGASPDPSDTKFDPQSVHHVRTGMYSLLKCYSYGLLPSVSVALTKYLPKTKVRKQKNLLGGSTTDGEESEAEEEVGDLVGTDTPYFLEY